MGMLASAGCSVHSRLAGHRLHRLHGWLCSSRFPRQQACFAARAAADAESPAVAATGGSRATPQPGDVLELTCTDLAFGGEGICRMENAGGFVVFVDRALPGETLLARVTQSKRSFARAAKQRTLASHDSAAEPACEHFGPCGGCTLQSLAYEAQLAAKQRQVADLLARTAGVAHADVARLLRPIVGCPPGERYRYRNKMEFSFSSEAWQPEQQAAGTAQTNDEGSSSTHRRHRQGAGASAAARPASRAGGTDPSGLALGLHRPGSVAEVLPISRCHLQSDAADALLLRIQQLCRQLGLQPYDAGSRTGLLQDVVIRRGTPSRHSTCGGSPGAAGDAAVGAGEEYLVNIVTALDGRQALAPLAGALMKFNPGPQLPGSTGGGTLALPAQQPARSTHPPPSPVVVGVVNSVSQPGRPVGERRLAAEHVLAGRGSLTESLCGLEFEVSANSFFQTNTRQAEVLYKLVAQAAELRPTDTLLDLYCGTGSIGLTLAGSCRQVNGVELNPAAVRDAERNATRNGIANATFLQGDLHKLQLEGRLPKPDVVVVDPARPGLSQLVIDYLRRCGARRIVYVSCNAATQARDIKALCSGGGGGSDSGSAGSGGREGDGSHGGSADGGGSSGPFRVVSVQAVDLYPQTHHVETVAVLDSLPQPSGASHE